MGQRIAGTCFVKIDGEQLSVQGALECPINPLVRETQMDVQGVAGFKETAQMPYIKLTAYRLKNFPLEKIQHGTDMTVTAEFSTQDTYTLSGAYLVGEPTHRAEDGTVELEFNGVRGQWN